MRRESLLRDAEKEFKEPRRVVESQELSYTDKKKILDKWRLDLLELQRATDENVASSGNAPGEVAEMLSQVNEALEMLRRSEAYE